MLSHARVARDTTSISPATKRYIAMYDVAACTTSTTPYTHYTHIHIDRTHQSACCTLTCSAADPQCSRAETISAALARTGAPSRFSPSSQPPHKARGDRLCAHGAPLQSLQTRKQRCCGLNHGPPRLLCAQLEGRSRAEGGWHVSAEADAGCHAQRRLQLHCCYQRQHLVGLRVEQLQCLAVQLQGVARHVAERPA